MGGHFWTGFPASILAACDRSSHHTHQIRRLEDRRQSKANLNRRIAELSTSDGIYRDLREA
jgi:hypothetical protein